MILLGTLFHFLKFLKVFFLKKKKRVWPNGFNFIPSNFSARLVQLPQFERFQVITKMLPCDVDGNKWQEQRKISRHEFSTKMLWDFSISIFKKNAAKLSNIVSKAATSKNMLEILVNMFWFFWKILSYCLLSSTWLALHVKMFQ